MQFSDKKITLMGDTGAQHTSSLRLKSSMQSLQSSKFKSMSSSTSLRKDPNQEFFQMCLLSYKMMHQSNEAVMEMDHRELY